MVSKQQIVSLKKKKKHDISGFEKPQWQVRRESKDFEEPFPKLYISHLLLENSKAQPKKRTNTIQYNADEKRKTESVGSGSLQHPIQTDVLEKKTKNKDPPLLAPLLWAPPRSS